MRLRILAAVVLAGGMVVGQHHEAVKQEERTGPGGRIAPLLEGLGNHHHPVTTGAPMTQRFFDQGLRLAYAFNHAEAIRAFREAARLDPECAMAYWGHALALGPNINDAMTPEREDEAWAVLQKALALKSKASEKEQAYIDALAARYSNAKDRDRKTLDAAYARAMAALAKRYPDDLDAATLYAEARMNLRPWDYWTKDGKPQPGLEELVPLLESVMARDPSHPGANHYYIHAVEPTKTPERAVPAADRLGKLMPTAGHMVHMPAHIYIRVGRYADASEANVRAIASDEDYITQCRAQGIYPLAYYPHNIHFLWASSTMEGRSAVAIDAARKVASKVPRNEASEIPAWAEPFVVTPLYALTRFGKWDEILKEPLPARQPFATGVWHYARGIALTRKGRQKEAEQELTKIQKILRDNQAAEAGVGLNTARAVLDIASEVLAGELAATRKDFSKAIAHLERAVRLEDGLTYNEPADWHYPVRQSLGAVLLEAGRPGEAGTVYWEDLKRNPDNGWSLFGLTQALRAQGKSGQAAEVDKRFREAWARADAGLAASRF